MILDLAMRAWMGLLAVLLVATDVFFAGIAWVVCQLFWHAILKHMAGGGGEHGDGGGSIDQRS